ncbi:cyclic nucleotide-binding domain-containing protein [Mangrovicoccus ximenensis]|uniref:cyclic nucleotide-binding domain-containing protein n=1 Tax=Mangrovicoccus ximenensis TaxID=1911570 RepID=UPI000D3DAEE9|nr:cyclic nucleotide-binding domain-containing protein [Mangrovicoccus ximenensis]
MSFDTIVVADWSGASSPTPAKPSKDAIWLGIARGGTVETSYHRTREDAVAALCALFEAEIAAGRRVLAGFDFPFAYPRGFAGAVCGGPDPLSLWEALAARIEDGPDNANNRWQAAAELNGLFPGTGPFWGCPATVGDPRLPAKGSVRQGHGLPERRGCEERLKTAQPCWKLYTTGSVGSQALLGIARLQGMRARFGAEIAVRPFESRAAPVTLVELFPSLIAPVIADLAEPEEIKDRAQVRVLAGALARLDPAALAGQRRRGGSRPCGRGPGMSRSAPPWQGLPLFEGIAAERLAPLNLRWSAPSFAPGQMVFDREDPGRDVYFLLSGALLAVYWTEDGREVVYTRIGTGAMLGELSAIDGGARSLAIFARAPSRLLQLPEASFHLLLDEVPEIRRRVMRDLVGRIRDLTQKAHELSTYSIEQRLCAYLVRLSLQTGSLHPGAVIADAPTHLEIAGSIGANREMVSRSMSRLAKRGAIRTARKKIEILDPDLLSDVL